MKQISLRVPESLAAELAREAADRGTSVNSLATTVLRAAVDPDFSGDEAERLRARLRRAGLLANPEGAAPDPPTSEELERARAAAGDGTQLSELVSAGRGPR
ncbi:MAG: toxin-antitoxin system HicB family antitoxin [Thermoleophilaceae bacterium]